jgi:hypothetical protein
MDNPVAYTIAEFCEAHRISKGHFYNLKKLARGPRVMDLGGRKVISAEAAADWRRERESEGA